MQNHAGRRTAHDRAHGDGFAGVTDMTIELEGIHHLTAVSAKIRDKKRFYTRTLGMRLVKRSVNQDDVSAYHLFYADAKGTPGTDLTFFDWPVPPEMRGSRSIARTSLRVNGADTLEFWKSQLGQQGVRAGEIEERDGRLTLDVEDPEGQRLALVDDGGKGDAPAPSQKSPVPPERQVSGLGPIVMSVPDLRRTDPVLTGVMEMNHVREYQNNDGPPHTVHVYQMAGDG